MTKYAHNNDVQKSSILKPFRKAGFTLAEVLITLGIIGVVAAMVIPSLISSFQKKIYYSKFMKARMVIENAVKLFVDETGCAESIINSRSGSCYDDFPKYFNVSTIITTDNYKEVCKNYSKVAQNYDGTDIMNGIEYICGNTICSYRKQGYAFITKDGMFFNLCSDGGYSEGSFVDTNGPSNGPNTFGRDIFVYYSPFENPLNSFCNNAWGYTKSCWENATCYGDDKYGVNCAARLIEEGKMNY